MPELPEVETTRRGIAPHIESQHVTKVIIRNPKLRWPIPNNINKILLNQTVHSISRRAKYLLFTCDSGTLIIHLGMSGHLQIIDDDQVPAKHDHADISFSNGLTLRYTDPRRFGAILWTDSDIHRHKLIENLGPEPLSEEFDADYLFTIAKNRRTVIKTFIMNGNNVVGVGNIYANEALFIAGIHPKTLTGSVDRKKMEKLVIAIKQVLDKAISAGGTTLRDFKKSDGKPGYFAQELNVYGHENDSCPQCGSKIMHYKEAQRATFYCPQCQTL